MPTTFAIWRSRGPDWHADRAPKEQPLWNEHAEFMNRLAADGFVRLGGPLDDGDEYLLIVHADSEAAIRARLAQDPWTSAGLLVLKRVARWTVLLDSSTRKAGT